jgi:hypothetical protein
MPEHPSTQRSVPPTTDANAGPIFVLGMTHRCGSNLVWKLLELHPDCTLSPIREDFVLHHADKLVEFVESLREAWAPYDASRHQRLTPRFAQALLGELKPEGCGRLVVKTPSVRNLDLVFELFPSARVLVLVRDGRDVVASGMLGFDWDFDSATAAWATAARTVTEFVRDHDGDRGRFAVVRFEELWSERRRAVERLLDAAALDPSRYDFDAAERLPVYGSSELLRAETGKPDWNGVTMPTGFRPTERWRTWSARRRRRFALLAGDAMRQLGYDCDEQRVSTLDAVYQRARDAKAATVGLLRRLVGRARR